MTLRRNDPIVHELTKLYGFVCHYCGETVEKRVTIDHEIPVSAGGTDDISNLHLCCMRCNIRKSAMSIEEFRRKDWFENELGVRLVNDKKGKTPSVYTTALEKIELYTGKKFDHTQHKFYFEKINKQ